MVMHSKLLIYLHCSEPSYIRTEPFDVFENETKTIPLQRSKKLQEEVLHLNASDMFDC